MTREDMVIAELPIKVVRKKNLKNLYITVDPPDGKIAVKAPLGISVSEIELFVLKKLPDIEKARERMRAQPRQSKRRYVSGEAFYLWGKPYRLQVVYGKAKPSIVKSPNKIVMNVPEGADESYREHLMTEWYRKELKRVLPSALSRCESRMGITVNEVCVKSMKTKWGTCNIDEGRIWINLQLVKKPPECLEYVIIHELVHLLEKNHTHRFNALVEKYCPFWQEAKKLLASMPLDSIDTNAGCSNAV